MWAKYSFDGVDGDYFEYRFAKNGSRNTAPDLDVTVSEPEGWSVIMPSVGSLEYLWFTIARKTSSGELLQEWGIPKRMTPVDGVDGAPGTPAPILVFRGDYDDTKKYYGTSKRVDAVKYNGIHYVARTDAPADDSGCFTGHAPLTDSAAEDLFWNTFGAEYDSVATNLLLAEGANIGDWFMSGGKIVSTLQNSNKITLDASMASIVVESSLSGGDYSESKYEGSTIKLDANSGIVEARNKTNNRVAYMSPSGIFCNNAETQAVSACTGKEHKAAIVGLGHGNVDKYEWRNENFLAGVYGTAINNGTAPAYGGFFQNLMAAGLLLNIRAIEDQTNTSGDIITGYTYLNNTDSLVIGYARNEQIVYLPNDSVIGRIIFFKQWWSGNMKVYSRGGQKIYDDHTANSYFRVPEGKLAIAIFTTGYIAGVETEAWLINTIHNLIND